MISFLKPYLRWLILGSTVFFLLKAFKDHWQEVAAISINNNQWLILFIAFAVTLGSFVWSGWVWYLILCYFRQPAQPGWALKVYLKTNIAKFIPGNVWHFYGRIWIVREAGFSLGAATISVLLEPLLMAASASVVVLTGSVLGLMTPLEVIYGKLPVVGSWLASLDGIYTRLPGVGLFFVLLGVHPRILNPLVARLNHLKFKKSAWLSFKRSRKASGTKNQSVHDGEGEIVQLKSYPLMPLIGELSFILLKALGFIITLAALTDITLEQVPLLLSVFSFAWLLGLLVPTPGGIGVFETTIFALLEPHFAASTILATVALFRLISTTAEAIAAFLAWLLDKIQLKSV